MKSNKIRVNLKKPNYIPTYTKQEHFMPEKHKIICNKCNIELVLFCNNDTPVFKYCNKCQQFYNLNY